MRWSTACANGVVYLQFPLCVFFFLQKSARVKASFFIVVVVVEHVATV